MIVTPGMQRKFLVWGRFKKSTAGSVKVTDAASNVFTYPIDLNALFAEVTVPGEALVNLPATAEVSVDGVIKKTVVLDAESGAVDLTALNSAVANAEAARDDALSALAEMEAQVPGSSLGYAEKVNGFTTTNTEATTVSNITGLSVTVMGTGRPAEVSFYAPNVFHSVANTTVGFLLNVNGSLTSAIGQTGSVSAPGTTAGHSFYMSRQVVLTSGVSYTFQVSVYGGAAGTSSLTAAGFTPITLSVTAR